MLLKILATVVWQKLGPQHFHNSRCTHVGVEKAKIGISLAEDVTWITFQRGNSSGLTTCASAVTTQVETNLNINHSAEHLLSLFKYTKWKNINIIYIYIYKKTYKSLL